MTVTSRGRMHRWAAAMMTVALTLGLSSVGVAKDIVIHAGRLIDGVSKQPRSKVSIVISKDRITAVQDGFVTPDGAEVIDLSGCHGPARSD